MRQYKPQWTQRLVAWRLAPGAKPLSEPTLAYH